MSAVYISSKMSDNFNVWKQHFINQAKGLIPHQDQFYKVITAGREEGSKEDEKNVKIISPLKGIVERAENAPTNIYDPTTGVIRQSLKKPRKVRRSKKKAPRKRKPQVRKKSKKSLRKIKGRIIKKKK